MTTVKTVHVDQLMSHYGIVPFWSAESSELEWRPGYWPETLEVDGWPAVGSHPGGVKTFCRAEVLVSDDNELQGWIYRVPGTLLEIKVFND